MVKTIVCVIVGIWRSYLSPRRSNRLYADRCMMGVNGMVFRLALGDRYLEESSEKHRKDLTGFVFTGLIPPSQTRQVYALKIRCFLVQRPS